MHLTFGYNSSMSTEELRKLASLIRYYILCASTQAGSGHPTSSLSAADLMTVLWFAGNYRFDFKNPDNPGNDRLVFSKGHATPLYYSLFLAAGQITPEEIMTMRKFDSNLEGHPTPRFKFTEAATGSLGQGLSVGVGLALAMKKFEARNSKLETNSPPKADQPRAENGQNSKIQNNSDFGFRLPAGKAGISDFPRVFVLLGDGEMAEGSTWEAFNLAGYYKLANLVAIVDVNRLGQSQATMLEWDTAAYQRRLQAFGWDTTVVDGHDFKEINAAFHEA